MNNVIIMNFLKMLKIIMKSDLGFEIGLLVKESL